MINFTICVYVCIYIYIYIYLHTYTHNAYKDTRAMIEGHKKDIEEFNSGVKRKRDAAAPKAPEPIIQ